jgi:hypothetical protein
MSGEYISVSNGKHPVSNVKKRAKMFAVCAWMQIAVICTNLFVETPRKFITNKKYYMFPQTQSTIIICFIAMQTYKELINLHMLRKSRNKK